MADEKNSSENENEFEIESIGSEEVPASNGGKNGGEDTLRAELEKCKNDFLYLRADFDNYRKGVIKERSDLVKYGSERVFVELLDVLDNFERAISVELTPETIENYKKGIALTANELKKVLSKFGVVEQPSAGCPFDPTLHEALSSEETTEVPAGHIVRVFKKAYKLHDRVIRPAQVVVAREPKATQ